jgi:diguanylate cyclase (GGDEF)-like protein
MRMGAQDYVNKHDPARLIPVVERELRNASLRREKRAADSSIAQLSRFDSLTRLPNRMSLQEVVEIALAKPEAAGRAPALLVLDLDRFMHVNESLGFHVGDQLLQQVATRLQFCVGATACVARLGADEFGILETGMRADASAAGLAERIERSFSQPFIIAGHELYATFSMGLARFPDHGSSFVELLRNAESAMCRAKGRGGSRMHVYDHGLNDQAEHRLRLENALRGAIERNELSVLYQPIVDLRTQRMIGTEALVRWRHPQFGTILPDEFIPIAEETGLIAEIGEWVLDTAIRQTQHWRKAGMAFMKVAVNISAQQFRSPTLVDRISALLEKSGLPPQYLEVEITETAAMEDAAAAVQTLRALKVRGVEIALDDFGTGFSSLSYLKRFPIDILKIDRSFVRDLPGDEEDAAIVRMIAALGQSLGLQLHAEGIEDQAQRQFVQHHGCHRAQGYDISPPLSAEEVPAFVKAHRAPAAVPQSRARPPSSLPRMTGFESAASA